MFQDHWYILALFFFSQHPCQVETSLVLLAFQLLLQSSDLLLCFLQLFLKCCFVVFKHLLCLTRQEIRQRKQTETTSIRNAQHTHAHSIITFSSSSSFFFQICNQTACAETTQEHMFSTHMQTSSPAPRSPVFSSTL